MRLREEVRPSVLARTMSLKSMHAVTCALYLVAPLGEDDAIDPPEVAESFWAILATEADRYGIVLW